MTYNELYQKMNHWTTMLEKGVVTLGVFNSAISFILQVYDRGPNKEMSKPSSSNSSLENPIMTPPSGAAESIKMPYSTKAPTSPLSDLAQVGRPSADYSNFTGQRRAA
jgi:hypothetical protein